MGVKKEAIHSFRQYNEINRSEKDRWDSTLCNCYINQLTVHIKLAKVAYKKIFILKYYPALIE